MLSDIEFQEVQTSLFTPNIKAKYSDFRLVSQATTYKVFQAKAKNSFQFYTIRVLDIESDDVVLDRDKAVTLFFQEIFRLCASQPELPVTEEFEFYEDKIAFVTKPYTTLKSLLTEKKDLKAQKAPINIEKLLKNVSSDLEFLLNKMKFDAITIDLSNICVNKADESFFVADWYKSSLKIPALKRSFSLIEAKKQAQKNASYEMSKIGTVLLTLHGVDPNSLQAIINANNTAGLEELIAGLKVPESLKKLLKRMFSKDLSARPTLIELANLPLESEVDKAEAPEEQKKDDEGEADVEFTPRSKRDKDKNGISYAFAKFLKRKPINKNARVNKLLSKLGDFKYLWDTPEDSLWDSLGPYEILSNGAIYIGQWKHGMRHGRGMQIWADGARYDGYWRNNMQEGKGRLIQADGDVYEGDWVEDKMNGKGTYTYSDGARYEGEWFDGLQHGKGVDTWPDGSRYEGEYSEGKMYGKGLYKWADGSQYDGEYENNAMEGHGTYIWGDGRYYDGEWQNNQMHGKGTYIWPDGRKYIGYHHHDKKHGYGELELPDGRKYNGFWKEGKQHGKGTLILANGEAKEGEWEEGKVSRWF